MPQMCIKILLKNLIGTDLLHHKVKGHLLEIRFYSDYSEVAQLSSTTQHSAIIDMKGFFVRHGTPLCACCHY